MKRISFDAVIPARLHRYLPEATASLQAGAKHCGQVKTVPIAKRIGMDSHLPCFAIALRRASVGMTLYSTFCIFSC